MTWDERQAKHKDRLSMVSLGYLLILISAVFLVTPNFTDEIITFFEDFHLAEADSSVLLPAPKSSHPVIYTATTQFCVAYGLFQIVLLFLRFVYRDSLDKKAGTVSGIVFWLGMGYVLNLLRTEQIGWFVFVGGLIIFVGMSITIKNLVVLSSRATRR